MIKIDETFEYIWRHRVWNKLLRANFKFSAHSSQKKNLKAFNYTKIYLFFLYFPMQPLKMRERFGFQPRCTWTNQEEIKENQKELKVYFKLRIKETFLISLVTVWKFLEGKFLTRSFFKNISTIISVINDMKNRYLNCEE